MVEKTRVGVVDRDNVLELDLAMKELDAEGLNPNADDTEETASRRAAVELNFILSE